jgi:hypothetical protein
MLFRQAIWWLFIFFAASQITIERQHRWVPRLRLHLNSISRIVLKSNAGFNFKSLQRSSSTPMCINKIRRISATASGSAIAP